MADSKTPPLSEEEFARWLPAARALELVANAVGDYTAARLAILRRIEGGLIRACAETGKWEFGSKFGVLAARALIPDEVIEVWGSEGFSSLFWRIGDEKTEVHRRGYSLSQPPLVYFHYGVRLDPDGINNLAGITQPLATPVAQQDDAAILAKYGYALTEGKAAPTVPPPPPTVTPEKPDERKPVSETHLTAWAETFLRLRGDDYTEALAISSAQGMFPDKLVGRDRIRKALRQLRAEPVRKAGRKPTDKG